MFAPNLRRKIFGWLERFKNSAGIRLSHKKIQRRRGGWRRRLRGLAEIDRMRPRPRQQVVVVADVRPVKLCPEE